jgi:hypothetical protein
MKRTILLLCALIALAPRAGAEVVGVDVSSRSDVGNSGYEKIVGTVRFAVDPKDPHNRMIVDLDKAAVNGAGRVEFSADLYILRPKDPARSNGVALVDVVNRGNKTVLRSFSRASGAGINDPTTDADLGDGFLTKQGFTLVWVGWEFDVRRQGSSMGIVPPIAKGVSLVVRGDFTPNNREQSQTVTDLVGYTPADPAGADTALTVRDAPFDPPSTIARDRWTLKGNTVTLTGGFEPGRIYQLAYRVVDPPVPGAGLLAFRDVGAWVIKQSPALVPPVRYRIAFGSSQSGRFLREFLYEGCNTDEHGASVFDGVWAHIAGAARLQLNARGSTPTSLTMFASSAFPFTNAATHDPISGRREGLLENDRARANQPKMFLTNTSVEYWGGGRSAALVHTTPDGSTDLTLPANERAYFFTGTQHGPSPFPPRQSTGQQPENPNNYWLIMRSLMMSMDRWVRQGVAPPPSQVPHLADGSLVTLDRSAFPAIPGVASPRTIHAGRQDGTPIPLLVPQVDQDGNERAGIRLPEVAVPLATMTGWNFRSPAIGGTTELVTLMGSSIRFPKTKADAAAARDPRRSIDERYASRDLYLAQIRQAADRLVKSGFLLAEDVPEVVRRAEEEWGSTHAEVREGTAVVTTPDSVG